MDPNSQLEIPNVDRMIDYCTGVANEFLARHNRIRSFVTAHNLTSGTANETILRDFLSGFSTGSYGVGQGFICDPSVPDQAVQRRVSKQCDIIVYHRDYPLVHSEGEVKIVWPQSVRLFIEVKTKLDKAELKDGLENLYAAKLVPYMNLTESLLFAFNSLKPKTIVKHLRSNTDLSVRNAPTAILLLDEGVIIHRFLAVGYEQGDTYRVRKGNGDGKAIVMTFLLLFFFNKLMHNIAGGAGMANMINSLLDHRTQKIAEDFTIRN